MAGHSWKIYWSEYAKDAYVHGVGLNFLAKDDVEFSNALIPPGTVLKRWYSKTNYQRMNIEPALPMIDGEGSYHIRLDADAEPSDGLLLNLVFFDRYDQEAGFQIVRDGEADFRCPLKTFSYEVQLINGGAVQFHFHSIMITELTDGEQELTDSEQELTDGKQKDKKHIKKSNKSSGGRKNTERRRAERKNTGIPGAHCQR